ncbi:cobyrinate a,c-diamide synthase [Acetobacteraceae bacterium KSS8]|uniref:Cobyrinate a,c-diamide synthase n=1 Tax=Endosaccharibacter trunci TaxID=2812733 RepID=A0ABT1W498_9PROT|nr:cobyrinate a,c-diamide synthase [Acetobacteraceae bacterium KSS8]
MTAPKALLVAAPRSGGGKTTATLAILAALRARGLAVRAAKSGPDYIDPAFHEAASGRPSLTLDSWAMPPPVLRAMLRRASDSAELVVVESAMGLFDGAGDAAGRTGSAADLAEAFGLPVILVLDVSGQSQSVAAVAKGFASFRPGVRIAGVILNRVGSPRHRDGCARALAASGIPVLGAIGRDNGLALPERHLGLVQARENGALPALLGRLAAMAERDLDLDAILDIAAPLADQGGATLACVPPPGQRIAIAEDDAFSFLYPHLRDGWREAGAELFPFSPLADEPPPDSCDYVWLPGGYPELHAGRLAAAERFLSSLRRFADTRPVHGECGGHMVLGRTLVDADGVTHAMAGLLGHSTSFAKRRMHLGYREATLLGDSTLGPAGTTLRGHEFHYATETDAGGDPPLARLRDANGTDLGTAGQQRGLVSGSFFHVIARQPSE